MTDKSTGKLMHQPTEKEPMFHIFVVIYMFAYGCFCAGGGVMGSEIVKNNEVGGGACRGEMHDLIAIIDEYISLHPNGPSDILDNKIKKYLGLLGCSEDDFVRETGLSINFHGVQDIGNYIVVVFYDRAGTMEVGLSYFRKEKKIDGGYAMINKDSNRR